LDGHERHVVGHYRLGQPFQRERADFFERYGLLDRDGHSLPDKDLTVLGLSAKTRGEIAHGADRCIAGAFRKADLTERRVTLGDPSTKPEQSATSAPAGDQCAPRLAHRHRHLDTALGGIGFFILADVAANARRKAQGKTASPISPLALEAVRRIDALFDIERSINGQSAERRRAVRQELSAPLVADLER
jgi:hypothetical protein